MGSYLSAPITDTISFDKQTANYSYGVSSMQGWRASQEDAHSCCPDFDEETNTSLFAVYDGHGGSEVAQYCSMYLPDLIKRMPAYKEGNFEKLLVDAFLEFDASLLKDEVQKELRSISGMFEDEEIDAAVDPARLIEEAKMPIQQLRAKYEKIFEKESKAKCEKDEEEPKSEENSQKVMNGHEKSDANGEKADSSEKSQESVTIKCDGSKTENGCTSSEPGNTIKDEVSNSTDSTEEKRKKGVDSSAEGSSTSEKHIEKPSTSSGTSHLIKDIDDEDDESDEDYLEGDDDEDDGEDVDCDEDDDGDEDDDDMLTDEGERLYMTPEMLAKEDEPGYGSGTTVILGLLRDKKLYVANVGDSRCVLCRGGKAVDMSIDHKPEDKVESDRVTKAGGVVTSDGRVNAGLNLSRALGDHMYKHNTELPLKDQMISPLPDILTAELTTNDEFMVIACDGIWNSMSSQEVVDYIHNKLIEENPIKLSQICEQLFREILAPDAHKTDGTGCDNMTCIIVQFNPSKKRASDNKNSSSVDTVKSNVDAKRQKLDTSSEKIVEQDSSVDTSTG